MTHEEIAALKAHNEGLSRSVLKLQVDLDAQLQLHKDKDAAHAAEIAALKQQLAENGKR